MKKLMNILEKYKISVYISLPIIIIGIMGIILWNLNFNKTALKTYENDNYSLQYDQGWVLKEKGDKKITLKHGKVANLNIEIIELKDESRYSSIVDLIDEINYNIENQNPHYKLISKKETTVSKYDFNGYKLLYENNDSQVMTTIYKKSDKLVMFNYEANNDYFDILLDSVHNIIYNYDAKEKKYDLSNKITLNTNDVSYSKDKELDKAFSKNNSYELADKNYYVKYSIPSNFQLSNFDSTGGYFQLRGIDEKNIYITVNILNSNIFEYLDKENSWNIYTSYKTYKEDKDYSDFKETLTKINGKVDTYLYKNSYNYNNAITYDKDLKVKKYKRKDENAQIIYALNKNHILVINISTTGTAITKKLIDNIEIDEIKNISSYITSKKENDLLVSELKRYNGYDKEKIDKVIIKIPNKYQEFQKYNNIFAERYFGLNYDEEKIMYDYEIHYELTTTSAKIKNKVDSMNSSFSMAYGTYNYLTYSDEITLNNCKFVVYTGGYTQLGGIMFTNINRFKYYINKKVLFYELASGGYLVIEISGNGKEITENILNDATNFEIKEVD